MATAKMSLAERNLHSSLGINYGKIPYILKTIVQSELGYRSGFVLRFLAGTGPVQDKCGRNIGLRTRAFIRSGSGMNNVEKVLCEHVRQRNTVFLSMKYTKIVG